MRQAGLRHLLENYVLGCIGYLPVETESYMSQHIPQTYRSDADWRTTLRRVLKLDDGLDDRLRQMWSAHQEKAALTGTPPDPRGFATLALEDADFAHLWRPPKPTNMACFADPITVKAIGFWRGIDGSLPQYPKPQDFVQPNWHVAELKLIIAYLRSGYNARAWCGWSTCRFEGCAEGEFNGTKEFTDTE
jgi:hypothetical protein